MSHSLIKFLQRSPRTHIESFSKDVNFDVKDWLNKNIENACSLLWPSRSTTKSSVKRSSGQKHRPVKTEEVIASTLSPASSPKGTVGKLLSTTSPPTKVSKRGSPASRSSGLLATASLQPHSQGSATCTQHVLSKDKAPSMLLNDKVQLLNYDITFQKPLLVTATSKEIENRMAFVVFSIIVRNSISTSHFPNYSINVSSRKHLDFHLAPLLASTEIAPDILVSILDCPAVLIEVHSKKTSKCVDFDGYQQAIIKLVANQVDLMRWLMSHFQYTIPYLEGYVLPTFFESAHGRKLGFATKITTQFTFKQEIKFEVVLNMMEMVKFESSFVETVLSNCKAIIKCSEGPKVTCGVHSYLNLPAEFFEGNSKFAEQIPSKHSIILLSHSNKVYKCSFDNSGDGLDKLFMLKSKNSTLQHSLLPNDYEKHLGLQFWIYNRLDPPWNADKALHHIVKFTENVIIAIKELHDFGIAHLDIRLDNICFIPSTETPVLIDLGRCRNANEQYICDSVYQKSCMYSVPQYYKENLVVPLPNKKMDWVQVGFMLLWVLGGKTSAVQYHEMTIDMVQKVCSDGMVRSFLNSLISKGKVPASILIIMLYYCR